MANLGEARRDLSLVTCIGTSFIAYFLTVPFHEFLHLITHYAYGNKVEWYSAGAVQSIDLIDYYSLSPFQRIMVAGGSASIINAIIAVALIIALFTVRMGPTLRVFLTQLMGGQLVQGMGYFLMGGLFGMGDWGNVFSYLNDSPGLVLALRISLSVIGATGVTFLFTYLTWCTYYFVRDPADRRERRGVAVRLHLLMFLTGMGVGLLSMLRSPMVLSGDLGLGSVLVFNMMWFPFLIAFAYAWLGIMVNPAKQSGRFLYLLDHEPNFVIFFVGVALVLVDILVFGPGIRL